MSRDNTMRGLPAPSPLRQAYVKGTQVRIVGMSETIAGTTGLLGFDEQGTPEYDDNGTEVSWDSSEPSTDKQGRTLYVGSDHRSYTLDQCEWGTTTGRGKRTPCVPEPAPAPQAPVFLCDAEERTAREGWQKCAKLYRLKPEWLGREYIRPTGDAAIILGLKTTRSRFPVFVRRADGLTYHVTTIEVRRALGGG